jgi:hypothetical protein
MVYGENGMKLYKRESDAQERCIVDPIFIAKFCPFHVRMSSRAMCGNWCPHFFTDDSKTVYITCTGTEVSVGELDD